MTKKKMLGLALTVTAALSLPVFSTAYDASYDASKGGERYLLSMGRGGDTESTDTARGTYDNNTGSALRSYTGVTDNNGTGTGGGTGDTGGTGDMGTGGTGGSGSGTGGTGGTGDMGTGGTGGTGSGSGTGGTGGTGGGGM